MQFFLGIGKPKNLGNPIFFFLANRKPKHLGKSHFFRYQKPKNITFLKILMFGESEINWIFKGIDWYCCKKYLSLHKSGNYQKSNFFRYWKPEHFRKSNFFLGIGKPKNFQKSNFF